MQLLLWRAIRSLRFDYRRLLNAVVFNVKMRTNLGKTTNFGGSQHIQYSFFRITQIGANCCLFFHVSFSLMFQMMQATESPNIIVDQLPHQMLLIYLNPNLNT